jgi:mannosyltransferase
VVETRPGAGQQATGQVAGTPAGARERPGWLLFALPFVVPFAAELVVGGYRIAGPSLWRDEAATISGSRRPVGAIMDLITHQDAVHGFYYLIMHVVIAAGGISATTLRLPSLIAMALTAGLTGVLGRRLARLTGLAAPSAIGLLGGLALVAVPLTTRYAQEARPYALASLFAVLATYLLVRAAGAGRWPWWAGYAAAVVLTGLFNLFALLLVLAHGLSLAWARTRAADSAERESGPGPEVRAERTAWWGWLGACGVAGVLLAPLAIFSVRQAGQLSWVTRPDPSTVASLMRDFAGSDLALPFVALLAVLGCAAGPGLRRGRGLSLAVVAVPWLLLPPVLLLAISLADPLYVERYVVFCLPALSLLAAAGLVWLVRLTADAVARRGLDGRRAQAVAVLPSALLAVVVLAALVSPQLAIRKPTARADDLRAVSAVLAAHERAGDAVLYLPWDTAVVGMAYPAPFARLRDIGLGTSPIASATLRGLPARRSVLAARLRTVRRVWTVQWTPSQPSVGPAGQGSTSVLTSAGFLLVRRWRIQSVFLSLYAARS